MAWNDSVVLIGKVVTEEDDLLQPIFSETKHEILCNKRSLTRSEFYFASQAGLKPSMVLEVHSFEYKNQNYLEFNGKRYKVLKTFDQSPEIIELTCEAIFEEMESTDEQ